jgi:hypothetical protein
MVSKMRTEHEAMYDLKLSRRLTLIKSSLVISRVSRLQITDVSGTISVTIIMAMMSLMMRTEMLSETSVTFNQLTRLVARDDVIN